VFTVQKRGVMSLTPQGVLCCQSNWCRK